MVFAALGILSAIIFLIGDTPYLIDTIKIEGRTKPHRVTWGIVVLLNIIGFASQWASGASNSLWLFGAAVLMTGAIFLASLKKGVGGHSKEDVVAIAICILGLLLWATFDSPLLSILASIFVSVVALVPTFAKAKRMPESETRIAWLMGAVGALLATISVGRLDYQLLLLPGVSMMLQGYMVYILYFNNAQIPLKAH